MHSIAPHSQRALQPPRQTRVSLIGLVALTTLLSAGAAISAPGTSESWISVADARSLPAPQAYIAAAAPAPIELSPAPPPKLTAAPAVAPTIEPRTRTAPTIQRAPVESRKLAVASPISAEVQREIRRLERAAQTQRGYGSTAASAQAAWVLGLVYLHGAGVRRDLRLAHTWFDRAALFGREPWAYAGQAWCAIDGCAGPANPELARRAIAQLRKKHPARADFLEWILAARETPLQISAPGLMQTEILQLPQRPLLEKAASQGDMHALIELGLNEVTNNRLPSAMEYFRRAGPRSQAALANITHLESRMNAARLSQSSESADATAAQLLAQARKFHRGAGVPVNYVEAVRLYRLADAKGSVEARRMLNLIFSRPSPTMGGINIGWMQQLAFADPMTTIPTVGIPSTIDLLYREPSPLYDLLPVFWQKQITQMER